MNSRRTFVNEYTTYMSLMVNPQLAEHFKWRGREGGGMDDTLLKDLSVGGGGGDSQSGFEANGVSRRATAKNVGH